ncbi:MAG: glucose-6-phosphate dehydrogenase [Verrucomicrobiae bacterium]|nr:glucose-6-phosphate dehydrogenase [Verrucomicrobiae bacterium]
MSNSHAQYERPGDPCIFVIYGSSGDLTKRKLLPALYNLLLHNLLSDNFAIICVARRDLTQEQVRAQFDQDIHQFATQKVDEVIWAKLKDRLYYCKGEFDNRQTYETLNGMLTEVGQKHHTQGNVLFYLSTPPEYFDHIIKNMGLVGLTQQNDHGTPWKRVIIEKPFGYDLESAKALNASVRQVLHEDQIYRIDHYLGKETVQNMMVFRFGNGIFEPVWNRRFIDHVQITTAETVGVETRGAFYEKAGVLRDVIQNHMFMLLALTAMDPPSSLRADAVRNEKMKVLESIRPMTPEEVIQNTVRGQYDAGVAGGKNYPAYRGEKNVSPTSNTETFAALKLYVDNWRWAGVPFYLRSGKCLAERKTEIVVQFRRAPLAFFGGQEGNASLASDLGPNRLIMSIQPDEGISIEMLAKTPGAFIRTQSVNLEFNYKDFGTNPPSTGYETLIHDCMVGDPTLFHRTDMVEAAWAVATPILDVWKSLPARDFPNYPAGSWGPAAADRLIEQDGRKWVNDHKLKQQAC